MQIISLRDVFTSRSTTSVATVAGLRPFHFLELPRTYGGIRNVQGKTCILPGEYDLELYDSPKHGLVLLLKDVPGRSLVEIHKANKPRQLLGCLAPGLTRRVDYVEDSKRAFDPLIAAAKAALERGEKVSIKISEVRAP